MCSILELEGLIYHWFHLNHSSQETILRRIGRYPEEVPSVAAPSSPITPYEPGTLSVIDVDLEVRNSVNGSVIPS